MIVGVHGRFGSGKDEVARFLSEAGFKRRAFADPLKIEVATLLAGAPLPPGLPENLVALIDDLDGKPAAVFRKPTSRDARALLQGYGTEFRRRQEDGYWLRSLEPYLLGVVNVVIPDVRFKNELGFVRSKGGVCWTVRRPGHNCLYGEDIESHESEHDLVDAVFDATVLNDGTLEELQAKVYALCVS